MPLHDTRIPTFPQNIKDYAPWVTTHGLYAPYGKCQCGCGNDTNLSAWNDKRTGMVKGLPRRYFGGHVAKGKTRPSAFSIDERFWAKVNKNGPIHPILGTPCWEWQANVNNRGYGQFCVRAPKYVLAHRFSYELHNGPVAEGLDICHKCDNPKCVNPKHLFSGTVSDNMQDMIRKSRGNAPRKLTDSQKTEICAMYATGNYSQAKIGRSFGVTQTVIGQIIRKSAHRPFVRINNKKLTPEQVEQIRQLYATGDYYQHQLAKKFSISQSSICEIVNHQTYTDG